ncbi:MAG: VOC family protein [Gammaproteobacteria bacterium]|nr:VOC family protein [Gammaproteobacteria bacterium]
MSKKVSPIPRGYRTAMPCLTVYDVNAAVAFYQAAFGAELVSSHTGADESISVHATIKIGNSLIAINQEAIELGLLSPFSSGVSAGQVHLYVEDVDTSWNRAVEAGAVVRTPLFDAYWGDRTGVLADPNGQLWSIASKVENVSKEEMQRRSRAALTGVSEEVENEAVSDELVDFADAPFYAETPVVAEETVTA